MFHKLRFNQCYVNTFMPINNIFFFLNMLSPSFFTASKQGLNFFFKILLCFLLDLQMWVNNIPHVLTLIFSITLDIIADIILQYNINTMQSNIGIFEHYSVIISIQSNIVIFEYCNAILSIQYRHVAFEYYNIIKCSKHATLNYA